MIEIQPKQLIITIAHPSPELLLKDLKESLFDVLQEIEVNKNTDMELYNKNKYAILELIKNLNS